jgi:hypothetical protein
MSSVLSYLEDVITVDSGQLLKAVLKVSAGKQLTTVIRSLKPDDQEVTVETLTNDIVVMIGIDPWQARRAAHKLIRNKFVVPVLSAEIQFEHDDYQRINRTKNPVNALVADVAVEFGDFEDAFILTATNITVGDNDGMAQTGNFTAWTTALDATDFALGSVSLATAIGLLVAGMKGEVRKNPLVLIISPNVESVAAGVFNTNSDKSLLTAWDEQVKSRGGPGSGILVAENLACTIAFSDGVLAITTVDSKAALISKTPKVMSTFASRYDPRLRPYNSADGYYNKIVERWINLVHNAEGIIFEAGVTVT